MLSIRLPKNAKIADIWSPLVWDSLAAQIEDTVYHTVKPHLPRVSWKGEEAVPTDHRIEEFVRKLSKSKKNPHLHVGLTSSDLEDNIRFARIMECVRILEEKRKKFAKVFDKFLQKYGNQSIVGRTHLIPTRNITLAKRFLPAFDRIQCCRVPSLHGKGIGGSLGDNFALRYLGAEIPKLFPEEQKHKNQTSDMLAELHFSMWMAELAAYLHQMAFNLRWMVGAGEATMQEKKVGSSAFAFKKTNPFRLERVCSLARLIPNLVTVVWDDISENLLERTLDNQSNLRISLPFYTQAMGDVWDDFTQVIPRIAITRKVVCLPNGEKEFLDLIKQGNSRCGAQKKIFEKYNNL